MLPDADIHVPETKFLRQGVRKLQLKQDRQTHRQMRLDALPAAFTATAEIACNADEDFSADNVHSRSSIVVPIEVACMTSC